MVERRPTIDINQPGSMANQTIGGLEKIIEANAKANFLNDL
jgi:hypothetical protein